MNGTLSNKLLIILKLSIVDFRVEFTKPDMDEEQNHPLRCWIISSVKFRVLPAKCQ